MVTLEQIIQACVDEVKIDKHKRIWSDDLWTKYINQAIRRIQKDGNFEWNENVTEYVLPLVGGTQEYDFVSDFVRMDYAIMEDGQILTKTTKQDVLRKGTTSNGKPVSYYIRGGKIGFWATPDKAYNVNVLYKRVMPALSSTNNTLEFSDSFEDLIVKYAAYLAWSSPRGNAQEAQMKLQDYRMELDSVKSLELANDMADMVFSNGRSNRPYNAQVIDY